MAKEIERKFLAEWNLVENRFYTLIKQGYILLAKNRHLRIRLSFTDDNYSFGSIKQKAELCLKFTGELERDEFEYEIPLSDGIEIFAKCEYTLEKKRYELNDGSTVDEYSNGVYVLEKEFKTLKAANEFVVPSWYGIDVTNDKAYSNIELAKLNLKF